MIRRFPKKFFDEIPDHLVEDFKLKHSLSDMGWLNLQELEINPVFYSITDKPRFEYPALRAAEWDLFRLYIISHLEGWYYLRDEWPEGNNSVQKFWDHVMDATYVAFYYFTHYPERFFELVWRTYCVRNIPETYWTQYEIELGKKDIEGTGLVKLENEIASYMSGKLDTQHKCHVERLYDHSFTLPIEKRGIYWLIYPEKYQLTFSEGQFPGLSELRPAYEIVLFSPNDGNRVSIHKRDCNISDHEILDIWQRKVTGAAGSIKSLPINIPGQDELHMKLDDGARFLWWHGKQLPLSINQYKIVEFFLNELNERRPQLMQAEVLEALSEREGIKSKTIKDAFKDKPEIYKTIFQHDNAGRYWITGTN